MASNNNTRPAENFIRDFRATLPTLIRTELQAVARAQVERTLREQASNNQGAQAATRLIRENTGSGDVQGEVERGREGKGRLVAHGHGLRFDRIHIISPGGTERELTEELCRKWDSSNAGYRGN
jgi:hypothetical protein